MGRTQATGNLKDASILNDKAYIAMYFSLLLILNISVRRTIENDTRNVKLNLEKEKWWDVFLTFVSDPKQFIYKTEIYYRKFQKGQNKKRYTIKLEALLFRLNSAPPPRPANITF